MRHFFKSYFVRKKAILSLLLICFISRGITSIYYIEDIDSLRFALSAIEFNILDSRPHFPGYAVYCFFLQIVYFFTQNIGLTFSLIGGFSIFLILVFSKKIIKELDLSYTFYFIIFLFFNPLLWLMSNRYMPDSMGLSFLIISLYFFIKTAKNHNKNDYIFLGISLALLSGIRLSFMPFFLPVICLFNKPKFIYTVFFFFLVVLIWLIPLVYITGYNNFLNIFINDFHGHFFKWGGTVLSSNASYFDRLIKIFEFTFSDGFSFWSEDRNWITILNSIFLSLISLIFIVNKSKYFSLSIRKEYILIILCYFSYFIWIYFFQNINYKSRHIIPFIPLISIIFSLSILNLNLKKMISKIFVFTGICIYIYITINLTVQHKNQSAISQISSLILNSENDKTVVFSDGLKLFYWAKLVPENKVDFVNLNNLNTQMIIKYYNSDYTILSTSRLNDLENIDYKILDFYHNPFVNRLWSHLTIYKYE
tara:strand:- start:2612 stop:4048 length:1437 start_codon:yes stop_codon:yes gene_type:complete